MYQKGMEVELKKSRPLLKVCGIKTLADLEFCAKVGIDFVGFNLISTSPRFIEMAEVRKIWSAFLTASPIFQPKPVLVMSRPTLDFITELFKVGSFKPIIQLHGNETSDDLKLIKNRFPSVEIWKAVTIKSDNSEINQMIAGFRDADLLLFDGKNPGSGTRFHWNQLKLSSELSGRVWGIAGGINASNLKEAHALNPTLIDVCSGVEHLPGMKDHKKVLEIVTIHQDV